jgi:hypothetical protein
MASDPDAGIDTLALPTLLSPVFGSLDRPFLSAVEEALAVVSCCHDCVLSVLTERDRRRSMLRKICFSSKRAHCEPWRGCQCHTVCRVHVGTSTTATPSSDVRIAITNSASLRRTWRHMAQPGDMNGRAYSDHGCRNVYARCFKRTHATDSRHEEVPS